MPSRTRSRTGSRLLTTRQVGAWLRISPGTVARLARQGRLPGVRIGGQWRFRVADLGRREVPVPARTGAVEELQSDR